mgnify:CR=1 FL=1
MYLIVVSWCQIDTIEYQYDVLKKDQLEEILFALENYLVES